MCPVKGGDAWSLRHFFQCLTGGVEILLAEEGEMSLITNDKGSCGLDSAELKSLGDVCVSSESEKVNENNDKSAFLCKIHAMK